MASVSVPRSAEFERVAALPRRVLDPTDCAEFVELCIEEFRRPGGSMRPHGAQAIAVVEAVECGGAFVGYPVGVGKTLIMYLSLLAFGWQRPALVVKKAHAAPLEHALTELRAQWRDPAAMPRIFSREELQRDGHQHDVADYAPDGILLDEAHRFANPSAATARRIDRYLQDCPATNVIALSGTPSRKSIMSYWHLLAWTLGDRAPVPLDADEAQIWADVLDESPRMQRPDPGPLGMTPEHALAWYARRLRETPGVLLYDVDSCDKPLTLHMRRARECPAIDAAMEDLWLKGEDPGGEPVTTPIVRWGLDGRLGCGVSYYMDPPPPEEWREARREAAKVIRWAIEHSTGKGRKALDTAAQVYRAMPTNEVLLRWRELQPTFKPITYPRWISQATVQDAIAFLREIKRPALIFTGTVEYGRALATASGLPYYGEEGTDEKTGRHLIKADPTKSAIVSWVANMECVNLQAWSVGLIVHPPQSAQYLEQLCGRMHRQGQRNPVHIYILVTSGGTEDAIASALAEAQRVADRESLTQKILRANIIPPNPPPVTATNRYRWAKRS